MTSQTLRLLLNVESTSSAMADWEKRGEEENAKIEYLENKNSFLDEIKNIFHSF